MDGLSDQAERTVITLPAGSGRPITGDWNGDGVTTPGRYDGGKWFTTDAAVGLPAWSLLATWGGQSQDRPVVGQLDGDNRADVGVFRDGQWLWKLSSGGQRTDSFGQAGDVPLVGDWDGDGRDDLGVFRAGTWVLRLTDATAKPDWVGKGIVASPEARGLILTFPFGTANDVPVVGDWDANGRFEPAVVRGSEWVLSRGLDRPAKTVTMATQTGDVPLVASVLPAPGQCPTATKEGQRTGARLARLVRPPTRLTGDPSMPGAPQIQASVEDSLRFAYANDLGKRLAKRAGYAYYDPLSTHPTQEESLRRSANIAQAGAIMLTTTGWKSKNGITRAELLDYVRWHVRSIACQHISITPGGWGNVWQSALWASTAGMAGWLIWPSLSAQERAYVAAMVSAEADDAAARGPRYFRTRDGKELTPGDSRADEVSWDAVAPSLALAMMPNHPHAAAWRRAVIELSIASFARPSDLTGKTVVNGVSLAKSLPGTNANEDGTITNHRIVNPDYTQNVLHLWWGASLLRAARQPVPESMFVNTDIVYRALAVVKFPSPPYAPPGGTTYKPDGQIYYPMGTGWGTRRPATFTGVDAFAWLYTPKDTRAAKFLAAHAADTRAMQLRWKDGRIYIEGAAEESYKLGKEEYAMSQMALAWWAGAVKKGPTLRVTRKAFPGIDLQAR